jgi:two-component system response regulator AtoC
MKKSILLVEDDPNVSRSVRDIMGDEHRIKECKSLDEALKSLGAEPFNLVIFDHDLKSDGGIDGYKKLRRFDPHARVVMMSVLGDIGVAVMAARLGVSDFLKKPLEADKFKETISKNLALYDRGYTLNLEEVQGLGWLKGTSERLLRLFKDVSGVVQGRSDVVIYSERGIDKASIANIIHGAGPFSQRRFVTLDLLSFGREGTESHFWSTIQKLLQGRSSEVTSEDLTGTIMLNGLEHLSDHFTLSVLDFLKKRRSATDLEKIDKGVRIVLTIEDPEKLVELEAEGHLSGLAQIYLPPLRERREDIPLILDAHLSDLSGRRNKSVKNVSSDALKFLVIYDWPGNYRELELLADVAALKSTTGCISLKDLPLDSGALVREHLREWLLESGYSLDNLRRGFEKKLYGIILENVDGDEGRAASFLDLPKTTFSDRARSLGLL